MRTRVGANISAKLTASAVMGIMRIGIREPRNSRPILGKSKFGDTGAAARLGCFGRTPPVSIELPLLLFRGRKLYLEGLRAGATSRLFRPGWSAESSFLGADQPVPGLDSASPSSANRCRLLGRGLEGGSNPRLFRFSRSLAAISSPA